MKNLTTTERDLIAIIMDCIFFNTGISLHQKYPGISLCNIDDGHICHLAITAESPFFNSLKDMLNYECSMNYLKEIKTLGYSDCIISGVTKIVDESIFSKEYCEDLQWYNKDSIIFVNVTGIYIDFKSIETVIRKLKQCGVYGFTLNTEKLVDKLYTDIRNGFYDLNEDEYI